MTENLPTLPPDGSNWLEQFNLPQMIAGPAGKALSRLVAGVTDIPAAYLERISQGVRDDTANRHLVNSAVGKVAAKVAAKDPEIIQRALGSLLAKEFRKQENKETIARKTAQILEAAPQIDNEQPSPPPIDDDWMNIFERHAEEASTERMQDIWARILAGQIRKPRSFSLQTLRFVSELDEETAKLFAKYATEVVNGDFVPDVPSTGEKFDDLMRLEQLGLLSGASTILNKQFDLAPGTYNISYKTHKLTVVCSGQLKWNPRAAILSRLGREIYSIADVVDDVEKARLFVDTIPKESLRMVVYLSNDAPTEIPILIWKSTIPA